MKRQGHQNSFYVASSFNERENLKRFVEQIETELGWKCTSRWITDDQALGVNAKTAQMDMEDVEWSDTLIVFSAKSTTGGKWVELGMALAWDMPIYMIGHKPEKECIFQLLPQIQHFDSLDAFLDYMRGHRDV